MPAACQRIEPAIPDSGYCLFLQEGKSKVCQRGNQRKMRLCQFWPPWVMHGGVHIPARGDLCPQGLAARRQEDNDAGPGKFVRGRKSLRALTGQPGKWAGRPGSITPSYRCPTIGVGKIAWAPSHTMAIFGVLRVRCRGTNRRISERTCGRQSVFQCQLVPDVLRAHTGAREAVHGAGGPRRRPVGNCLGLPVQGGKGNEVLQLGDVVAVNVAQRGRQSQNEGMHDGTYGKVWHLHHPCSRPFG
jgi:hypothetical protein